MPAITYNFLVQVTMDETDIRASVSEDDIERGGLTEGMAQIVSERLATDYRITNVDVREDD